MKNKRTIIILIIVILLNIIGILYIFNLSNRVGEYNLDDYKYVIENYSSTKIVGQTNELSDVKKKARNEFILKFGNNEMEGRPIKVFFDFKNETWLIQAGLPKNSIGWVFYILIRQNDGKVLAIWRNWQKTVDNVTINFVYDGDNVILELYNTNLLNVGWKI